MKVLISKAEKYRRWNDQRREARGVSGTASGEKRTDSQTAPGGACLRAPLLPRLDAINPTVVRTLRQPLAIEIDSLTYGVVRQKLLYVIEWRSPLIP